MNNIHILEPDWDLALMLQGELEDSGYSVTICDNSVLFLMSMRAANTDLVIVDMDNNNDDALDLLQKLRNSFHDLPIILWTWNSDQRYDPRAIAADHIVYKQPDLTKLKTRMRMALDFLGSSEPATMTFGSKHGAMVFPAGEERPGPNHYPLLPLGEVM